MVSTMSSPGGRDLPTEPVGGPLTRPGVSETLLLDPSTAYQRKDQPAPRPTAFVADALLVRGRHPDTEAALARVAERAGFRLVWDEEHPERDTRPTADVELLDAARLTDEQRAALEAVWVARVRLAPLDTRPDAVFRPRRGYRWVTCRRRGRRPCRAARRTSPRRA